MSQQYPQQPHPADGENGASDAPFGPPPPAPGTPYYGQTPPYSELSLYQPSHDSTAPALTPVKRDNGKFFGGIAMIVFAGLGFLGRWNEPPNAANHFESRGEVIGYVAANITWLVISIALIFLGIRLIKKSGEHR